MIAALLFVVQHAGALAVLLLVAAAAGTAVGGARIPLAARTALGLAVIGQAFVILGALGVLRPWAIVALALLALAGGAARMDQGARALRPPAAAALVALAAAPLFVLALHPPIAFDETLYHLPIVRAIADSGAIRFQARLRYPVFPELHEALCVPGFLALGDVATHLVSVAELLILAALLAGWRRSRPGEGHTAFLAAALLLGSPIALHLATITYVESALSLFVAAGFYFLDRATSDIGDDGEGEAGAPRDAAAAGFLLGSACSVKYLGGYFAAAALLYLLLFPPLRGAPRRRTVLPFLLALLTALLPTYALLVALGGSPVFPFLHRLFGATPWAVGHHGDGFSVVRLLRLPWDVTFAREHVNRQPPYSPFFALSLLATLVAALRDRRAAFLGALFLGYVVVFGLLPRDSRYLLPLLPLACVAGATAIARWKGLSVALSILSLSAGVAYAGWRIARLGPPPTDAARRREVLEREVPEYRALARRDPGGIYVCGAEQLQYFGDGDLLGEVVGPYAAEKILDGVRDAGELARRLERLGARDLLVSRRACRPEWQSLPAPPAFERVYSDAGAVLWRVSAQAK